MKKKIGSVVLAVLLVGMVFSSGCGPSAKEKELEVQVTELSAENAKLEGQLEGKDALIGELKGQIAKLAEEIADLEERQEEIDPQIAELEAKSIELEDQLAAKANEITELEDQKAELETQVEEEITAILAEIPADPTYAELEEFLKQDKTVGAYDLSAREFMINAREAGIRCYLAIAQLQSYYSMFFVAARTTDRGLIYFIPASDTMDVQLEAGQKYHELNDLPNPGYNDTILRIVIFD